MAKERDREREKDIKREGQKRKKSVPNEIIK